MNLNFIYMISSHDRWSMIEALATCLAAACALWAYIQSNKMRKLTSFDAVFTQLIANLHLFINNETVLEPKYIQPDNSITSGKINAFLAFSQRYKKSREGNKMFDESEIIELWNTFTDSLQYKSIFLNCFKYIYHMVEVVLESPLSEKEKSQYIGIIQSQLNLDILFCYLINQIVVNRGSKTNYSEKLKKYKFFKNLNDDHDGYERLVKFTIHTCIYEKYLD